MSFWTMGFSAFTSYSYVLKTAGPVPRVAPDFSLIDQFGHARTLKSFKGRYVLLHAFYGSCSTTCPIVLAQLDEIRSRLDPARRNNLEIVSLTIDPENDTLKRLYDLWNDMDRPDRWIMAQVASGATEQVARAFGIWVFKRKDGIINHSAYLFVIDPRGRIVRVIAPGLDSNETRHALENVV